MAILVAALSAVFLYREAEAWLKPRVANPSRAGLVAVLSFMGLGCTLVALAISLYARRASKWPVARGRVIRSEVEEDPSAESDSVTYKAAVTYTYEVNGLTYQGDRLTLGTMSSSPRGFALRTTAKYPVGSEIQVHYNPLKPAESVINPRSWTHLIPWLIAALLSAFAWAVATGRIRG
jgi:hypothetical protein